MLEDVDRAANRYVANVRDFDLAALIERTPPDRLRTAMGAQLRRLASETRFDVYDEVSDALARTARGETVDLTPDSPLDLRIRTLTAEASAARQMVSGQRAWHDDNDPVTQSDFSAWALRVQAARALREFVDAGRRRPPRRSCLCGCPRTGGRSWQRTWRGEKQKQAASRTGCGDVRRGLESPAGGDRKVSSWTAASSTRSVNWPSAPG